MCSRRGRGRRVGRRAVASSSMKCYKILVLEWGPMKPCIEFCEFVHDATKNLRKKGPCRLQRGRGPARAGAPSYGDDGRGASMMIRGRDLLTGVPRETEISQAHVAEALGEPVQQICEAVMTALEVTPPDLAADIVDRGVMLTGGGALLGDLDLALRERTGLAVSIADESLNCVAMGTGKALEYEKQLRHAIDYDS